MLPGGALVLVDGGAIVAVEPGGAPAPGGWEVRYEPGTTVMPGLIDTHTHLCGDSGPEALDRLPGLSPDEIDEVVERSLAIQLAAGVTTVRDLGDQEWAVVDRHRGDQGGSHAIRPAVIASGPPITTSDGHCAAMGGGIGPAGQSPARPGRSKGANDSGAGGSDSADDDGGRVEALRRAVRERADRGADVVKVMTTGGMMTLGTDIRACQFTLGELRALVDEAHRLGLPVTAHAHALTGVQQCVAAGVDGIEHCTCVGPDGIRMPDGLAEEIAAAGIVVGPTVGHRFPGGEPPPDVAVRMAQAGFDLARRREQVGRLHRGGVTLVSGVDSGIHPAKPHGFLPRTIAELVSCGVPEVAALASATGSAARACGVAGRTGRLRAGLDADLLIVRGDPAADIGALEAMHAVYRRGRAPGD
jgi:imidazolonepropionase-like amidohydrolase